MILTVIVPTVPGREEALSRCLFYLGHHPAAEIVVVDGPGKMGDKICDGLDRASGEWSVVVDDDDMVPATYLYMIVSSLTGREVDALGYKMLITVDHRFGRVVNMRHGGELPPWHELHHDDWSLLPKCVWRTEYGRRLGFGNHYTADQDFAVGLAALVENAAFIPAVMYHYDKRTAHEFGGPVSGYGRWPA